ncbi:MAG: translation initiation factor IF-2 [Nitrospinota bacterium]|nr:translation initiation factor IF-2 [Nitrospinota bacterium]
MAGIKIYELARDIGMPSKDLAAWALEAGFSVKTHMSSVDEKTAKEIRAGMKKSVLVTGSKSDAAKKAPTKKSETTKRPAPAKTKKADPKKPSGAAKTQAKTPVKKTKTKVKPADEKVEAGAENGIDELEALERQLETLAEQEATKAPPKVETPVEEATPEPPQPEEPAAEEPAAEPVVAEAEPEPAAPPPAAVEEEAPSAPPESPGDETPEPEDSLEAPPVEATKILLPEARTVKELADLLGKTTGDVLMKMMGKGIVSNVNSLVNNQTAMELAREFGFDPELAEADVDADIEEDEEEKEEDLVPRPPVVTVMGHVDHGKTSLLDSIRQTNVTQTEAGNITQHIGAYHVTVDKGTIVFLDTPGHEAFSAMRARGAEVTDIVVLTVAANDGVMPQTREAVDHARAAGVPIVVAVNKIDLADADPEKVRRELSELGLAPEAWGGETIYVDVSAKERLNIGGLLEMILLQSEIMELKANPNRRAKSIVLEAELDRGRGPVARILVQQGTLKLGDPFVTGLHHGRVRALVNDEGRKVESAGPSMPVEVLGLSGIPQAGDSFVVVEDERQARQIANQRMQRRRQEDRGSTVRVTLEDLYRGVQEGFVKELPIVLKADAQGSIGALQDALEGLGGEEVRVRVIHSSVGGVTESDVMLASASNALIIGFHVRPTPQAAVSAQREEVEIRLYNVIYEVIQEMKAAMSGLLDPTIKETVLGRVEVREVFHIPRVGSVAGCYVTDGTVQRNVSARVIRDNVVVYEGKVGSLRRFKEDVAEVNNGYECGIGIENFQDVKQGDIIEPYALEEVERTL